MRLAVSAVAERDLAQASILSCCEIKTQNPSLILITTMPKVFGPLDEERLRALVDDDSDLICSQFDSARYALSRNDIGHGLQFLFAGFPACDFFAYLEIDKSKRDPLTRDWYINFGVRIARGLTGRDC